jgi:hypothetical protein
MSNDVTIVRTSGTTNLPASLRVAANDYHQEARVPLRTAIAGETTAKEAIVQDALWTYRHLELRRIIKEEEAEEREWDSIVSKPHVKHALRRMAAEARRQYHAGETKEGGFGVE